MFSGEELGRAWGGLLTAVREGQPDFGVAQGDGEPGLSFWDYMSLHPSKRETFDDSMRALSEYSTTSGEAAATYDFSQGGKATTVVDVGGGTGRLIASILAKFTGMRGTLFDQSEVLADAGPILESAGVADRCDRVAGSFFEEDCIPKGADVYLMKNIIHDWGDQDSLAILQRVSEAMGEGSSSTLCILDLVKSTRVSYEPWNLDFADFFDLNMLVTVGGRERSRSEWDALLSQAGMRITKVCRAEGVMNAGAPCVIEVKKV